MSETTSCSICMDCIDYKNTCNKCNYTICNDCTKSWFSEHNNCPHCRSLGTFKSVWKYGKYK